jgi:hypothetical protein
MKILEAGARIQLPCCNGAISIRGIKSILYADAKDAKVRAHRRNINLILVASASCHAEGEKQNGRHTEARRP